MFPIDSDTLQIRDLVRDFVRDKVLPVAADIDVRDEFPRQLYGEMAGLGLLAMTLPEALGGIGANTLAWSVVQEELARGSAAVADAMMVNKLMCDLLMANAGEALSAELVPAMGQGELICAIAQTEPDVGSDVAAVRTTARPVDGGFVLNGTKQFITFAGICDFAVVVATTDRQLGSAGIALFLADAQSEGFTRGGKSKIMGVRGLATGELVFRDCFVPTDRMLAVPGTGLKKALTSLNSGRIGMAAQSVGIAQAAFDLAKAFALERKAFGGPIADLQSIQFMLADMSTSIEAARLMTWRAAVARDSGKTPIREAAEAKLFASEMATRVVDDSMQIHAAHGYSTDAPIERLYRDSRVYRIWEGTSQIQKLIIARQLLSAERALH